MEKYTVQRNGGKLGKWALCREDRGFPEILIIFKTKKEAEAAAADYNEKNAFVQGSLSHVITNALKEPAEAIYEFSGLVEVVAVISPKGWSKRVNVTGDSLTAIVKDVFKLL